MWAELKAPVVVAGPDPAGRQRAAVTVLSGQQVRLDGGWHTVRDVRTEQCTSGGLIVVLGLDPGPRQRIAAAELLTVRTGRQGPVTGDRGPGSGEPHG